VPRIGSGVPLVGRRGELAALRSALSAAADGRAGAVLLAGDAGVGKSRLLAELSEAARRDGVAVLTGRCLDVERAGLPYLPFVEALGRLPVSGASRQDDAMEQLRLFEAVHTELAERAAGECVLLALEDLHWADAATRDLLLFLVSRLSRQRLLVVATYRLDDLHRRHPLRPLLTELARLPAVERIELPPFDRADAMAFVSALSEGSLPESTLRGIAERSQGNAFFCEELAAVYGSGTGVPAGLAEVLLARVERLGRNAQRVVRAASGAGSAVEHSVLQAVTELDDIDEALREAVQHNVLVADDNGYAFRHALLGEAVYGDLLPGERVRLHASYARLAKSPALLAYHSLQSHDLPTALTASVQAAEEAAEMLAPVEALRHVEQALRLVGTIPDSGFSEYSLLRMASRLALAAGDSDRAIAYARSSIELAEDPESGADARHQLAEALIPLETASPEIGVAVAEAWELVKDRPPSVTQAKILALRAREWVWAWHDGLDLAELERLAEQARAMAVSFGAHDVEIDALVTLAVFAEWHGRLEEGQRLYRTAAARAAATGAYAAGLRALNNLGVSMFCHGQFRETLRIADEVIERATAVGLTWSEKAVDARIMRRDMRFILGEHGATAGGEDLSSAPPWAARHIEATALLWLAIAGRFDELDQAAERLMADVDNLRILVWIRFALAEAALLRGAPEKAVEQGLLILDWLASLPRSAVAQARAAGAIVLTGLADIAADARRRHDGAAVREAVAEGERVHELARWHGSRALHAQLVFESGNPETVVMEARMAADLSRLRGDNNADLWRATVAVSQSDYWRAGARRRLAEALLDAGRRDEAAAELRAAHAEAVRVEAAPLREAIEGLAKRARIALSGVESETDDPFTPRERAVLELVSSGLTNRQIGERLYISEKTASVHLSRVMAKLGASSRTEAVSLAYDRGLLA
jgi:DNA-binding NarL/FixJ family response regulator